MSRALVNSLAAIAPVAQEPVQRALIERLATLVADVGRSKLSDQLRRRTEPGEAL
jgi:hypothetical protein